jgi:hypothetical protein
MAASRSYDGATTAETVDTSPAHWESRLRSSVKIGAAWR